MNPRPSCQLVSSGLRPVWTAGLSTFCVLLIFSTANALAQQGSLPNRNIAATQATLNLPDSPGSQGGTVTGLITDKDGATVANASITLNRQNQPPLIVFSGPDGRFTLTNVPPGPFQLVITASSFAARSVNATIRPGESLELPGIDLRGVGTTATVQVTATQTDIAQAQIQEAEKQRVLGVIPNFYVSYVSNPVPLNPRQKAELAYKTMLDPTTFVVAGVIAGVQQGTNTYPSWGQDAPAFGKRYAAAYGTFLTGTLLANAVLPIVLHQDPRYFVKGTGSPRSRVFYALANSVICKGDSMRWQPNYSSILGSLAASGISNFYYPAADRQGARLTFVNAAIGIGGTAVGNIFQEFLVRKLTPHTPKSPPNPPVAATPYAAKP